MVRTFNIYIIHYYDTLYPDDIALSKDAATKYLKKKGYLQPNDQDDTYWVHKDYEVQAQIFTVEALK